MKLNQSILRIFEVRAKPGKAGLLKQKLSDTSIKVVDGKPGNLGYFFGENLSSDENDLVFISIWQDLDSIKSLFGEQWESSFLPPGYEEIIDDCSIKHVEFEGQLISQVAANPDQSTDNR